MRLDRKKFQKIVDREKWTEEIICRRTGLTRRSVKWIMKNGEVSEDVLERIANMAGVEVGEISLPDLTAFNDNAIEFLKDHERATVSFSQGRYKSRIRKLAKERPGECLIVAENKGGSLCAHIPTSWVKISPPAARSEEQKEIARERMYRYHSKHGSTLHGKG